MSKYIIAFTDINGHNSEYYSGGSYMYSGEKYARYGNIQNAKRYDTRKIAESSARKLERGKCVNISPYYKIIEVEE